MNNRNKVLIIDDSEEIQLCLKVLLADNYQLFLAVDGKEGIDIALKESPDLILCDVMMPGMDGLACCRKLKSLLETSHIPVLMLTARMDEEDVLKGLDAGADDYLKKPFNAEILKSKIAGHIQNRILLKQSYTKQFLIPDENEICPSKGKEEEQRFISLLVKLIEENISDKNFKVKYLADCVNMSQTTLYRRVKQITALSAIELIRNVRLKRAAILLKSHKYSIQEVSEMVGYNDIPTFRKHFTEFFGKVPSVYAK